MISSPFFMILLFMISAAYALTNTEISSVLEFSKNNGKRYLNVVNLDDQDLDIKIANSSQEHVSNHLKRVIDGKLLCAWARACCCQ